jgi:hypothetical protein
METFLFFGGIKMLVYQYKIWKSGVLQSQSIIDDHLLSLSEIQDKNPHVTKIYLEAIIDA